MYRRIVFPDRPAGSNLVPEVFLDFSLHERAAKEPRSGTSREEEKS